ncbi:hypothetical protein M9458_019190, partial [Cirrhinus mrigala]
CIQRLYSNLTLNEDKCEYSKKKLDFFGYVFSDKGISADPKKIIAIKNLSAPQNVSEVRSLIGMTTYCSRFIRDYATTTQPLRELVQRDHIWNWGPEQQSALDKLKSQLIQNATMSYFDPRKTSTLVVDASPVGLGAILSQPGTDRSGDKVIAYASRALTSVEQRYSQTEREALAIVWACEHFHLYLYGSHFTVITDHKPLELIFNNPRASPPARLERWRLRLQQYTFTVQYNAGKGNPADYMSRHPVDGHHTDCSENAESYVNFIIDNTVPKAMTLDEVRRETRKDSILQMVIKELKGKGWTHLKQSMSDVEHAKLTAFHKLRHELTVNASQDIVLRGNRLVLPASLYQKAIQLAHVGHMGIVKTKQLIREKVWFPAIDAEVEKAVQGCIPCRAATVQHHTEPLKMSDLPAEPWVEVSVDFTGPFPSGDYLLVVVDDYSRYPEVEIVKSTAASAVIPKLDKIFSTFGIPAIVKTDNGPLFNSYCFADFSA